ncbi:MAG: hypothetical protein HUU10_04185 [Bacteroidetes bacterium]|nr:hypothetical protein [Bacteroidota bacterium]
MSGNSNVRDSFRYVRRITPAETNHIDNLISKLSSMGLKPSLVMDTVNRLKDSKRPVVQWTVDDFMQGESDQAPVRSDKYTQMVEISRIRGEIDLYTSILDSADEKIALHVAREIGFHRERAINRHTRNILTADWFRDPDVKSVTKQQIDQYRANLRSIISNHQNRLIAMGIRPHEPITAEYLRNQA